MIRKSVVVALVAVGATLAAGTAEAGVRGPRRDGDLEAAAEGRAGDSGCEDAQARADARWQIEPEEAAARLAYDEKLSKVLELARHNPKVLGNLIKELQTRVAVHDAISGA